MKTVWTILAMTLLCWNCTPPPRPSEATMDIAFRVLATDTFGTMRNVNLLVPEGEYTKETLEPPAINQQAALCGDSCNIHIYDDSLAYVLHMDMLRLERIASLPQADQSAHAELHAFMSTNHAFIAEHFLGTLVGIPQRFWFCPYKDTDRIH